MRKPTTFSPSLSESLETRDVPSAITFSPVIHPVGTFSQGNLPPFTGTGTGLVTTNALKVSTKTVAAPVVVAHPAVVVTHAVSPTTTTTTVTHPAGTFSQGNLPPFFGTGTGLLTTNRFI